jgi:hypothetical protein
VVRNPYLTFAEVLADRDMTGPMELDRVDDPGEFNSLRIFNVFSLPMVKNEVMGVALKDELKKRAVKYGYLEAITFPDPPVCYGLHVGCPASGVAQRAMREAAPHARGMSKVRQL